MRRAWLALVLGMGLGSSGLRADYETTHLIRLNNQALKVLGAHRAVWIEEMAIVEDHARVQRALNVARQRGVDWLFVAANQLHSGNFGAWRALVSAAHRNGVSVFALAGNPAWADQPEAMERHFGRIVAYQRSVNAGEWLDGVLYDLTPYFERIEVLTPDLLTRFPPGIEIEAKVEDEVKPIPPEQPPDRKPEQSRGLLKFVDLMQRARQETNRFHQSLRARVDSPIHRLLLGVVLPPDIKDVMVISGMRKPFYQHVVDTADFAVVRAYADRPDKIQGAARDILTYATETGKKALIGLHTGEPGDYPPETSFYDEDEKQMEATLAQVIEGVKQQPGFAGIALYELFSYLNLPQDRQLARGLKPW